MIENITRAKGFIPELILLLCSGLTIIWISPFILIFKLFGGYKPFRIIVDALKFILTAKNEACSVFDLIEKTK